MEPSSTAKQARLDQFFKKKVEVKPTAEEQPKEPVLEEQSGGPPIPDPLDMDEVSQALSQATVQQPQSQATQQDIPQEEAKVQSAAKPSGMGPTNIMGQPMKRHFRQGREPEDPEAELPIDAALLEAINTTELDASRIRIQQKDGQYIYSLIVDDDFFIKIVQNDVTKEEVTAITNAANSQLWHGGGVAGAISSKGGPSIQKESRDYVKQHGEVSTGACGLTRAGKLPCEYVIHTVGPIWNHYSPERNHALLKSAVLNTLECSKSLETESEAISVSIPAISSGIFGFPKEKCAEIMLKNTAKWAMMNKDSKVKEVRLTNFDAETYYIFKETLESMFMPLEKQRTKK